MKFIKRASALLLAVSVTVLFAIMPTSAEGLNKYDKSSYSEYLDKNLTCTEKTIVDFDSLNGLTGGTLSDDGRKGSCLYQKTTVNASGWEVVNMPAGSFNFAVDNIFKQTVKMWVYISDIDLLACDHDAVYDTPQKGSGTLYISFKTAGGSDHAWQHTLAGSGWHEIELSFDCHNCNYKSLANINYQSITGMRIWCNAKAGLELRFDDMRLCTYNNKNYTQPEAPLNGRWLSTCDYDALDGAILTEWYGACFDKNVKTQGSSSVTITGHKENVDHRVCIGVDSVHVVRDEDTICFDLYVNNMALCGSDWQIRFEHNAQAALYTTDYTSVVSCCVDENLNPVMIQKGWNHVQIPVRKMSATIGNEYKSMFDSYDFDITLMVFFIAGTGDSDDENYVIKYDNMYVAKTADIKAERNRINGTTGSEDASTVNDGESSTGSQAEISEGAKSTIGIILGVVAAVVVVTAIIVIVTVTKKKKKKAAEDEAAAVAEHEERRRQYLASHGDAAPAQDDSSAENGGGAEDKR